MCEYDAIGRWERLRWNNYGGLNGDPFRDMEDPRDASKNERCFGAFD